MAETLNMSTAPPVKPAFLGLESYTEQDAPFFFGRDEEIKNLYQMIRYNTLTLVFGKSGTGKTSLLNAGVFPLLRDDDCLPFRIRLVFNEESPSLIAQVWSVLKSQVADYNFRIDTYIEGETFWEFFHREDLWKVVTPVLVFDQFEEIFTIAGKYPGRKEELAALITELSDLIENIVPGKVKTRYLDDNKRIEYDYKRQKVKVIFAFREDFLVEMESITSEIPAVKNARFRLMPMNGTKAYDVITKTWKTAIDPAEAEKIVSYLVNEHEDQTGSLQNLRSFFDVLEIEPSLLSQVCASLDKERQNEHLEKISADFLKKYPKENILSSIYHQAIKDSVSAAGTGVSTEKEKTALEQAVRKFIEDNLVNENGFREKFPSKKIPEEMMPAIDGLKARFFIRQDGIFIELTHDVIAAIVKNERDLRRKADASRAAIKKALIIVVAAIFISLVVFGVASRYTAIAITDGQNKIDSLKDKYNSLYGKGTTMAGLQKKLNNLQNELAALQRELAKYQNRPNVDSPLNNVTDTATIKNLEQTIAACDSSLEETATKNQRLEKEIVSLNAEIAELEKSLENSNLKFSSLQKSSLDTSYFNIYQTHLDSLLMYKQTCPIEAQYKIDALEKQWEPFKNRSKHSQ